MGFRVLIIVVRDINNINFICVFVKILVVLIFKKIIIKMFIVWICVRCCFIVVINWKKRVFVNYRKEWIYCFGWNDVLMK